MSELSYTTPCPECGKEIQKNTGAVSAGGYFHTRCLIEKRNKEKAAVNTEGFIGRELFDHKNNKFNRECVRVETADLRASDNAHHAYNITVFHDYTTGMDNVPVEEVTLNFQNGGLKEVGANGITDQALIAVVLDRVRSFNDGQFRCRENSMVITKLEEALMWMEKRSNDRARRNVEGERIQ